MKYSLHKDLLNSNKITHCFVEKFSDYVAGENRFNPWSVEIHPTAKCNHRCIHCSYKERNEHRMSLSKEIMDNLIKSIIKMKVKGVYFSGGGEPTMYPNLASYIEELYKENVEVALLTNGTILEETGIIDIANMLNYIAISVPSCNPDAFNKITGSDFLEKVLSAPQKIKAKHNDNSPIVGARIVITNLIYKEVPNILKVMKERQFDYALFKVVRDYEDRGLGLDKEAESYLRNSVSQLKSENKINEDFTNLEYIFDFKKEVKFKDICHSNNMGLIANINTDGKVYPNIVEIDHKEFCIGDLNNNLLEEIWNSEEHKLVKDISNEKWKKGECKNCRAMAYNQIIDKFIENVPKERDFFI
ncbi:MULTISPECIES: radical SAM protein [unclassified Clostridium]|uniref:radical SAM/SPASM domain-containing protein n=1 Tax=unclassified Clostridium TaxID=2614128 RepID=UPI000297FD89|nr:MULTISPECIES: radical SAM protein [unclassified Clostridium]EKQ51118.1 MAG: radical SAM additional 4Fe4S-binding domain containing protein [Clostridium sp. Maddingley MBC34-26]